jgi:anti-anti-sigma factor
MRKLRFETSDFNGIKVLRLSGAIEPVSFGDLAAALSRHLSDNKRWIVLECSRVSYVGSNQLQELLDLARRARAAGGDIKLVGLLPTIRQVANLIAMGDPMDCYDELSDAARSFREASAPAMARS